jgi:hypothetical protein
MFDSILSNSHHYYVNFLHSTKIKSIKNFINLFHDDCQSEITKTKNQTIAHLQILIPKQYGSESVLLNNLIKKEESNYFWYDFYIGEINLEGNKMFFICYPYNRLKNYLDDIFEQKHIQCVFYKPELVLVLDYMKSDDKPEANNLKEGLIINITKFTASVTDDVNPHKVNISGENPLNSKVYKLICEDSSLITKTTSLKLKCLKTDYGELEISFDRLGNIRFWVGREAKEKPLEMLNIIFHFFKKIKSISESNYISSKTLLEDEK